MTIQDVQQILSLTFGDLCFNEAEHKYNLLIDGKFQTLKSVTTKVKELVNPFKTHQIADNVAKSYQKKGYSVDSDWIKRYWKAKGAVSREAGTLLHLYAEALPSPPPPKTNLEKAVLDYYYREIVEAGEQVVETESRVYFNGLAGTIDLLTLKEDGTLAIHDWKTNDDLHKSYGKLKAPFDKFNDSALNQYTIQLMLYKWIIENTTQLEVSEINVVSVKDNGAYKVELDGELINEIEAVLASKLASNEQ